jgi:hypothetical protein
MRSKEYRRLYQVCLDMALRSETRDARTSRNRRWMVYAMLTMRDLRAAWQPARAMLTPPQRNRPLKRSETGTAIPARDDWDKLQ